VWIFLFIAVVAVVVVIIVNVSTSPNKNLRQSHQHTRYYPAKSTRRIEDCISSEDVQYQISQETKRVVANVEASKAAIIGAMKAANTTLNTAWLNSYERIITVSANLDENLKYHGARQLEQSRFQYYASLHFRSMIAADIVHREFKEIDTSFRDINSFIVNTARSGRSQAQGVSKSQVYSAKDALKELRIVFLTRVQEMNKVTANFRDKIGSECGERGRQWRTDRMRNRG
jgi:hypothetical protein